MAEPRPATDPTASWLWPFLKQRRTCPHCRGSGLTSLSSRERMPRLLDHPWVCWFCEGHGKLPVGDVRGLAFMTRRAGELSLFAPPVSRRAARDHRESTARRMAAVVAASRAGGIYPASFGRGRGRLDAVTAGAASLESSPPPIT